MKMEHFQKKLEEEKARLESELSHIGRKNPAVPDDWEPVPPETGVDSDIADQAEVIIAQENNAALLADLEARYGTVLAALARLRENAYGTCEVCGKEVEEERLEADPSAATCIAHIR